MPRHARPSGLVLTLDPADGSPVRQLVQALTGAIEAGSIADGDPLPSSRTLAAAHRLPRSTVVAAYETLTGVGLLTTRPGGGTQVAAGAAELVRSGARPVVGRPAAEASPAHRLQAPTPPPTARAAWNLLPGHPDLELLDAAAWARAWRQAGSIVDDPHGSGGSFTALHDALAAHLRRFRGVVVDPGQLRLAPGIEPLLRRLVDDAGLAGRTIAMEDPGYPRARNAFRASGARVRPVGVDAEGLRVDRMRPTDAAVYLTPAHQYPMGVPLSLTRRVELIRWAAGTGALVIEDDYDGEFRYDTAPLPALRTLRGAAGQVAYLGTASKLLTPELRVAWAVWPDRLPAPDPADRVQVSGPTARALTHLLESDAVARHLARAMRTYASRRAALIAALHRDLPELAIAGAAAGLHLTLLLPPGRDDRDVVAALARRGYLVAPLSDYSPRRQPPGVVVGYARLPAAAAGRFVAALGVVLAPSHP